jgi:hypothetical protein
MADSETVSETAEIHSMLTGLIALERFVAFSRRESFESVNSDTYL